MKRTDPQFKLRLPANLKDQLERAADAGSRTVSNEIIRRLEWSFRTEGTEEFDRQPPAGIRTPEEAQRIAALESAVLSLLVDMGQVRDKLEL